MLVSVPTTSVNKSSNLRSMSSLNMASSILDLSLVDDLAIHLNATPEFSCLKLTPLSGGYGNYTFRLHLKSPYKGRQTLVAKHAKAYVASNKDIAFNLDRQIYEVKALQHVSTWLPQDSFTSVPEVHLHDSSENVNILIMDDCGETALSLKQYLIDGLGTVDSVQKVFTELGHFLSRLHVQRSPEDEAFRRIVDQNTQAKQLSAWATYGRLKSTLDGTNSDVPALAELGVTESELRTAEDIASTTTEKMMAASERVVQGDFWPGNVLLELSEENKGEVKRVHIIDWELCKTGIPGLDVGQFCAEIDLVRRFQPDTAGLATLGLEAFLHAYKGDTGGSKELAKATAIHIGVHLVVWTPRVPWGDKETTRATVLDGLKLVVGESDDWLKQSIAGALM